MNWAKLIATFPFRKFSEAMADGKITLTEALGLVAVIAGPAAVIAGAANPMVGMGVAAAGGVASTVSSVIQKRKKGDTAFNSKGAR